MEIEKEVYKIDTPILSAHNLIFGTPYLDIGEEAYITRLRNSEGLPDT